MIFLYLSLWALLLTLSASFALTESAITTLSAIRMKRLAVVSPSLSPYFHEWLANPHRLLSFLMVGNNLVNFGFSSLTAAAVLPLHTHFSREAVDVLVWLGVTAVILVVGEIVPKVVGRVYRERVAEATLPLMSRMSRGFFWVWGPIGWVLERWAPQLHRAPVNPLTVVSLEELQHAVAESQATGQMTGESGDMFYRTLALSQKTAVEVAQPPDRLVSLRLEILDRPNGEELFQDLLVETGHSRVPVTRDGRMLGYLHVKDVLTHARSGNAFQPEALMRPLHRVPPETRAVDLLHFFRTTGEAVALVETSEGRVQGWITLEDVLEEIVGEILDEYDLEEQGGTP
jgi:CBS domain containing-hemolysin-like protein